MNKNLQTHITDVNPCARVSFNEEKLVKPVRSPPANQSATAPYMLTIIA
jgi:hypothetical protein